MERILSAVTAIKHDGRILLLRRRDDDRSFPGTWCLPGGRVDPGESQREAAVRETLEETGLAIALARDLGQIDRPLPARDRLYLVRAFEATLLSDPTDLIDFPSDEHSAAVWITPEEALGTLTLSGKVTETVLRSLGS